MSSDLQSIEPLGSFQPKTGTMEAWNAAYVRVEDYLRAHRIHNRLHSSRLVLRLLAGVEACLELVDREQRPLQRCQVRESVTRSRHALQAFQSLVEQRRDLVVVELFEGRGRLVEIDQ